MRVLNLDDKGAGISQRPTKQPFKADLMDNTKEVREEIEALREITMPQYATAFSDLRKRLEDNGELEKYEKQLADVDHQSQEKRENYAKYMFQEAYKNGEFTK